MTGLLRVAGGAAQGYGEGLLEYAAAKRREALMAMQQEGADRRATLTQDRVDARAEAGRREQRGLLSNVVTDQAGQTYGITRGGDTMDLGIKQALPKSRQPIAGLSVEDQRAIDLAIERETTGKGSLEGESINWQNVASRLRRSGRSDLAERVASLSSSQSQGIDVDSPEYREAQSQAEAWAKDQAGLFSTDKTDFGDYGGNRQEAIRQKTLEIYGTLKSPGGTTTASRDGGSPPGSGTQESPYRATTQAHIDWVKNNAPDGVIIEVEGQLYQK